MAYDIIGGMRHKGRARAEFTRKNVNILFF
jgi:hypothetical protein